MGIFQSQLCKKCDCDDCICNKNRSSDFDFFAKSKKFNSERKFCTHCGDFYVDDKPPNKFCEVENAYNCYRMKIEDQPEEVKGM
jgi:hypothetical protein